MAKEETVGTCTGGAVCEAYCSALGGAADGLLSDDGDVFSSSSRLSDTAIESQSEVGSLDMLSVYDKKKEEAQG